VSFSIGGCPRRLPTFVEEEAIEQVCFSHVFFSLVRWVVGDLIGDVREEEALIPSQFCGTDRLPPIVYMLI
jgi:hypothetical protein